MNGTHIPKDFLETAQFKSTLNNPTQQQLQAIVDSGANVIITGAGGCGKTYMLRELKNQSQIAFSATTAAAAKLLNGTTIHKLIHTNNHRFKTVVVDECSMIGTSLFDQIYLWSLKSKT